MKKLSLFVSSIALLISSCSSIQVSTDYDRNADFASYKTYAFAKEVASLPINDINRKRLLDAIEVELKAKGFTPSQTPDILVDLTLRAQNKQSATAVTNNNMGMGMGRGYRYPMGGGFSTTQINVENYVEGTLFIDMIDMTKQQLVWQGRATKTIDPNANAKKREDKINQAVKEIFTRYPPKNK